MDAKYLEKLVDDLRDDIKTNFTEVNKRLSRLEENQSKDSKQIAVVMNTLKIVGATLVGVITLSGIVVQIVSFLTK